uniref:IPT/TIG domain-containing protein n=1 Tax=Phytophthora ramorum TaxID=164328 RepID=H3HBT7_PHYRM
MQAPAASLRLRLLEPCIGVVSGGTRLILHGVGFRPAPHSLTVRFRVNLQDAEDQDVQHGNVHVDASDHMSWTSRQFISNTVDVGGRFLLETQLECVLPSFERQAKRAIAARTSLAASSASVNSAPQLVPLSVEVILNGGEQRSNALTFKLHQPLEVRKVSPQSVLMASPAVVVTATLNILKLPAPVLHRTSTRSGQKTLEVLEEMNLLPVFIRVRQASERTGAVSEQTREGRWKLSPLGVYEVEFDAATMGFGAASVDVSLNRVDFFQCRSDSPPEGYGYRVHRDVLLRALEPACVSVTSGQVTEVRVMGDGFVDTGDIVVALSQKELPAQLTKDGQADAVIVTKAAASTKAIQVAQLNATYFGKNEIRCTVPANLPFGCTSFSVSLNGGRQFGKARVVGLLYRDRALQDISPASSSLSGGTQVTIRYSCLPLEDVDAFYQLQRLDPPRRIRVRIQPISYNLTDIGGILAKSVLAEASPDTPGPVLDDDPDYLISCQTPLWTESSTVSYDSGVTFFPVIDPPPSTTQPNPLAKDLSYLCFLFYPPPIVRTAIPLSADILGGSYIRLQGEHIVDHGAQPTVVFESAAMSRKLADSNTDQPAMRLCSGRRLVFKDVPGRARDGVITATTPTFSDEYANQNAQVDVALNGADFSGTSVPLRYFSRYSISRVDPPLGAFEVPVTLTVGSLVSFEFAERIATPTVDFRFGERPLHNLKEDEPVLSSAATFHAFPLPVFVLPPADRDRVYAFGPTSGGTVVVIKGMGFVPATKIYVRFASQFRDAFDGAAEIIVSAKVVDNETIKCISPPSNRLGRVALHVSYNLQQYSDSTCFFEYHAPTRYVAQGTLCGPISGQTPLHLLIQDTKAWSSNELVGLRVSLSRGDGELFEDTRIKFLFYDPPEGVIKIEPAAGPLAGGTEVLACQPPLHFTYYVEPILRRINPGWAAVEGANDALVIEGDYIRDFGCNLLVRFSLQDGKQPEVNGTVVGAHFISNSAASATGDGALQCVFPAAAPGFYELEVSLNGQQFSQSLYVSKTFGNLSGTACTALLPFRHFSSPFCLATATGPAAGGSTVVLFLACQLFGVRQNEREKYYSYESPSITEIAPSCGPTSGATQLVIEGANILDTAQIFVRFRSSVNEREFVLVPARYSRTFPVQSTAQLPSQAQPSPRVRDGAAAGKARTQTYQMLAEQSLKVQRASSVHGSSDSEGGATVLVDFTMNAGEQFIAHSVRFHYYQDVEPRQVKCVDSNQLVTKRRRSFVLLQETESRTELVIREPPKLLKRVSVTATRVDNQSEVGKMAPDDAGHCSFDMSNWSDQSYNVPVTFDFTCADSTRSISTSSRARLVLSASVNFQTLLALSLSPQIKNGPTVTLECTMPPLSFSGPATLVLPSAQDSKEPLTLHLRGENFVENRKIIVRVADKDKYFTTPGKLEQSTNAGASGSTTSSQKREEKYLSSIVGGTTGGGSIVALVSSWSTFTFTLRIECGDQRVFASCREVSVLAAVASGSVLSWEEEFELRVAADRRSPLLITAELTEPSLPKPLELAQAWIPLNSLLEGSSDVRRFSARLEEHFKRGNYVGSDAGLSSNSTTSEVELLCQLSPLILHPEFVTAQIPYPLLQQLSPQTLDVQVSSGDGFYSTANSFLVYKPPTVIQTTPSGDVVVTGSGFVNSGRVCVRLFAFKKNRFKNKDEEQQALASINRVKRFQRTDSTHDGFLSYFTRDVEGTFVSATSLKFRMPAYFTSYNIFYS